MVSVMVLNTGTQSVVGWLSTPDAIAHIESTLIATKAVFGSGTTKAVKSATKASRKSGLHLLPVQFGVIPVREIAHLRSSMGAAAMAA